MDSSTASDERVRIASWNVNGLRALFKKDCLRGLLAAEDPHIVCLCETKLTDEAVPKIKPLLPFPYKGYFACASRKKGYSGVGILTRIKPLTVAPLDVAEHDAEGRGLIAEFPAFILLVTYTPNIGERQARLDYRINHWDKDISRVIATCQKQKPIVWCGDLNIVHTRNDIFNSSGKDMWPCCTPQERSSFQSILDENDLVDTFRHLHPDLKRFTYFSRRIWNGEAKGKGWRLDYILVSRALASCVTKAHIEYQYAGSDHYPCFAELIFP